MKENNQKRKAEDILTEDSFEAGMETGIFQDDQIIEEEMALATGIRRAVRAGRTELDKDHKNLLDLRIIESINNSKRKRTFVWIGSVAAVLVLIGLTFIFQLETKSDISNYASGISVSPDSNVTRLLLSGGKEIKIDTQESHIEYSENGEEVKIDTQTNVEQQVLQDANPFHTVIVPYGKRTRLTLSDNSIIWLNSGSRLVYPAVFDADKREVYLEGEAMFDLNHQADRPFYVITRDLEVKVLGTVFNLSAYSDDKTVNAVLESGSVELRYNGNPILGKAKERMVPGMMAVLNPENKTIEQTKVNTADYTSWKDGYLVLEKNTLESIAKRLSRYYNVTITFENPELAGETFSGYLDLRNSAIQVFEVISEIVNIEIIQSDHQIKIKRKQTPA